VAPNIPGTPPMAPSQQVMGPSGPSAPEIFERDRRLVLSMNAPNCKAPKQAGVHHDWWTPAQSKRALAETDINVKVLKRRGVEKHD
jgi:hypothetical protein